MILFFEITSIVLLSILLFWTVYNGSIIYVGLRSRRKWSSCNYVNEEPKFSIIVPTKDEEVVIGRCLNGLLDLDYPKDKLEIIIVDGNSTDGTGKVCSEFSAKYPQIFKVINEKESKGKPAALNLALPYVTGEIVGTFDADSLPDKEVLRKVASYFNDKQVMAVQGRTTSLNEKKNILTRVAAMEEKAWYQALLSGREKLHLFVPLNGSCQFIRRNVMEELGGWNETSLTEDVELAVRLVEKKHLIKYAPDVVSGQESPNGLRELVKQRVRWYRGNMDVALKYGRLLDTLNKKTVDAEISLAGPFYDGGGVAQLRELVFPCIISLPKQPDNKFHRASNSFDSGLPCIRRHRLSCNGEAPEASKSAVDSSNLRLLAYSDVYCWVGFSEIDI